MRHLYKIMSVKDRSTGEDKLERVGRITYEPIVLSNNRLYAEYADERSGFALLTSFVEDVEDFNGGFSVTTENSIYTFEGLGSEE